MILVVKQIVNRSSSDSNDQAISIFFLFNTVISLGGHDNGRFWNKDWLKYSLNAGDDDGDDGGAKDAKDGDGDDGDDDLVLKMGWGVSGLSECLVRVVKTSGWQG